MQISTCRCFDSFILENVAPEASSLVIVANFHHVELGEYSAVHLEFVLLDRRNDFFSNVDGQQVEKALSRSDLTAQSVYFVGQTINVILVFKEGADRLVALIERVDIFLGGHLLFLIV